MAEKEVVQTMPTTPIETTAPISASGVQQEVAEVPERGYGEYPPQMNYRVVTDVITGRKMIKPIPPREKWTY